MLSLMSNNLRDVGAFGVRVLSGYLGKTVAPRSVKYHSSLQEFLSKQTKSQLVVSSGRVGGASPRREALYVWGPAPLAVRDGSYSLAGSVSTRSNKTRLTAPTGRGAIKRPA